MGYLTTLTIYNDEISSIQEDSKELCEKIYQAALSSERTTIGHKGFANLIKVQKSRHADDWTIYVHAGNSLNEMNTWSNETKRLMKINPKFFEKLVKYMEQQVKSLKKDLKNYKQLNK